MAKERKRKTGGRNGRRREELTTEPKTITRGTITQRQRARKMRGSL